MALPTSGPISFSQIQAEFGGANPISLSEYYRGGSYVPSTVSTIVREPASGELYSKNSTDWRVDSSGVYDGISWGGASISDSGGGTSFSSGGYTYYRGSQREKRTSTLLGKLLTIYHYGIYRTSGGSKTVNTGIPSSGAISLSQMRGGTKT